MATTLPFDELGLVFSRCRGASGMLVCKAWAAALQQRPRCFAAALVNLGYKDAVIRCDARGDVGILRIVAEGIDDPKAASWAAVELMVRSDRHPDVVATLARTCVAVDTDILEIAASLNRPECVRRIVATGIYTSISCESPLLHVAVAHGSHEVVDFLLAGSNGLDVDVDAVNVTMGRTALHECSLKKDDPRMVAMLLRAGASPHAVDRKGMTPLHYMVSCQNESRPLSVSLLLRWGANVHSRDNVYVRSPLFWAVIQGGCSEVIAALIRAGADVEERILDVTPLFAATINGREEAVVTLLEFGAECHGISIVRDDTVVMIAAHNGHTDMCERLARAGWACFCS